MTDKELMQQALDYLESEVPFYECEGNDPPTGLTECIEALSARLAQPEQDSGWRHVDRLLKTIRYLQGIAERGEGRTMREDESVEQFLLGYVKRLEAQPEQKPVARLFGSLPVYDIPQKQEPVAWRTFDGEGGYEYRSYEMNENYAEEWDKRNPNHKGWVEPLYKDPTPCQTCESLARTVMMDQTSHDTQPQREFIGLTAKDLVQIPASCYEGALWAEAKLKEKNT